MTKIRQWTLAVLCWAGWGLLYGFFLHLESSVEPRLVSDGHISYWWGVVFLYWAADTLLVLSLAWIVARPFGLRLPPRYPFFQFGTDVAVLVLLVHTSWFCTDHYLFPHLAATGLAALPYVFVFLALIWGGLSLLKFRQLSAIVRRLPQESVQKS